MLQKNAIVTLGEPTKLPEMGMTILIEPSRDGEKTRIHWEKLPRIESRSLTRDRKKD